MSRRRLLALPIAALVTLGLAACGSSSGGFAPSPTLSDTSGDTPAPDTSSPTSSAESSSVTTDTSSAASSGDHSCSDPDASWCDDFSDQDGGWQNVRTGSPRAYYADGLYVLSGGDGEVATIAAPVDTTSFSPDHQVQVEATVQFFGSTAKSTGGFVCWEHPTDSGSGTAGFVIEFSATSAAIGIWSETDGAYHNITRAKVDVDTELGADPVPIAAQCVQRADGSAFIALKIDDQLAVSTDYAGGTSSYPWAPSGKVGFLVGDTEEDGARTIVAYDDLVISNVQ